MARGNNNGPTPKGTGPWKGVRDLKDAFAVPPDYLRDASNMYIPDAKGGSGAYARPGFRRLTSVANAPRSDAIMRPRVLFMDHFSAGAAQSIGGGTDDYPSVFGRYRQINGAFNVIADSGPDGGGCIEATGGTASLVVTPPAAPDASVPDPAYATLIGTGEVPLPTESSLLTWHNLRGAVIPVGGVLLQVIGLHLAIHVMPDYTLRAAWHELHDAIDAYHEIGRSTATVPADGWFAAETQTGISPQFYDRGGYALTNLYTADRAATGEGAVRAVGVRTRGELSSLIENISQYTISSPSGARIGGVVIAGPYGTVQRYLYELFTAPAMPVADGDTIESIVSYEHHENIGLNAAGDPQDVGQNTVWGASARWSNLVSTSHSAKRADEDLNTDFALGSISVSTNKWTVGPTYGTDPIVRNTLVNAARDLYRTGLARSGVVAIEALAPFVLAAVRTLGGTWESPLGFGGRTAWDFVGPHPVYGPPNIFPQGDAHLGYRLLVKSPGGLVTLGRAGKALLQSTLSEWRALANYNLSPDSALSVDPATGVAWDPAALPQVGVEGEFAFLDAILPAIDPADRWIKVDIAQCGLDVAYRKRLAIAPAPEPFAPIAVLLNQSLGLAVGNVTVYDASVDFNGGMSSLLTGIVSRVIDWGDGSDPQAVLSGPSNAVTHHYALHGTYTATLRVTNTHGLSATATQTYIIPTEAPAALFSFDADPGDVSGMTAAFTDLSSNPTGRIVAWAWTFGDGGTSTLQNPTHLYATHSTFTVHLTVTDDLGQTATFSADVTVPFGGGGGDCDISTVASDDPFVQGDDYAGGNPPLPAYANTAALDSYLFGSTFREAYDSGNDPVNDGVSHSLDAGVMFNGRKTLKLVYGVSGPTLYRGAGWQTIPTDDASPENYYAAPLFGPQDLWTRLIIRPDAGLVSASGNLLLNNPTGNNFDVGLYLDNADHVWLFMGSRLAVSGAVSYIADVDLGSLASLQRTDGFLELITRYIGDSTGHTLRYSVWGGGACGLTGASALFDLTRAANVGSGSTNIARKLALDKTYWLQTNFTPVGALKSANVGLWEMRPLAAGSNANPYGLVLP